MRALAICLMALIASGCSLSNRSSVEQKKSGVVPTQADYSVTPNIQHAMPAKLYTNAEALAGHAFRNQGEVTGEDCQISNQDSPPNIPVARKHMQINASKRQADAVLLHRCEITSSTPGCYRQAVCIGSALMISTQ